jgi:hypothetical protein
MRLSSIRLGLAALCIVGVACAAAPGGGTMNSSMPGSGDGWRGLIDNGLSAWRGYKAQEVPAGWHVTDGVLMKEGVAEDLVSREEFGNYELTFDWRLAPGGNAGVFYRGTEEYDHIYWSGPEYQLLDDARHPDGRNRLTSAAAAYGLYAPPAGIVKPADEWNTARIVLRGSHVEHWLNGQKVVEYELGSPEWLERVRNSKFNEYPHYGRAARGRIGIQGDHNGALAIRDLRIRVLP